MTSLNPEAMVNVQILVDACVARGYKNWNWNMLSFSSTSVDHILGIAKEAGLEIADFQELKSLLRAAGFEPRQSPMISVPTRQYYISEDEEDEDATFEVRTQPSSNIVTWIRDLRKAA